MHMWSLYSLGCLLCLSLIALCQLEPQDWSAIPFNPPALPLAVRSPYLNVWLAQGDDPPAPYAVDTNFWTMNTSTGWYASAVVDDKEYRLLGEYLNTEGTPNQTAVEFTATRTSFLMSAGGVRFNMSFLSPIEPKNLTLQSLPFVYLYISAESTDEQQHRVRMYSDIEGSLIAGDRSAVVQWTAADTTDYVVLNMSLQNQVHFTENNDLSQDATMYYAFKKINGTTTTWSISSRDNTRGILAGNPANGSLNNQADANFRAADSSNNTAVLGISIDWGNILTTPEPAVWALGVVRNPSVQYRRPDNITENRSPYFVSTFGDTLDATTFFLDDFSRAVLAAATLDAQIRAAGEAISDQYVGLLFLTARQVMGSLDITIPSSRGTMNTSDVKIFMKNMGSIGSDNGTVASVNNVDALYAAFPLFLYINADLGGYLLAPLLEFQDSDTYNLPYAAQNIGSGYPNAVSDKLNDSNIYSVDESANMIIMTLAYSLASGNGTLLGKHYNLLGDWTDYLMGNGIVPSNQSSGDFSTNSDFTTDNQSNVALKCIIAIAAMAQIAKALGSVEDQVKYNNLAVSAIQNWQDRALSSSYINFILGNSSSIGMMYNLYANKLLRLGLVSETVYAASDQYYRTMADQDSYGIPLTNSPTQNSTTNWMMFAAASTADSSTRDLLVSKVFNYASNNLNSGPFTSMYDPVSGLAGPGTSMGSNSPAQGGIFALLALNTTNQTIFVPVFSGTGMAAGNASNTLNAGVIAGAIVGGVAFLSGVVALSFLIRRRRRLQRSCPNDTKASLLPRSFSMAKLEEHDIFEHRHSTLIISGPPKSKTVPNDTTDAQSKANPIQNILNLLDDPLGKQKTSDVNIKQHDENTPAPRDRSPPGIPGDATSNVGLAAQEEVDGRRDIDQPLVPSRLEFDSMRRELERLRQNHLASEEAPPSYSDV